jgi:transcriptional regulator with XRE-family HTH domain
MTVSGLWQASYMTDKSSGNPAFSHFGRQMKKERLARGWGLDELSRRTEINAGHLSRIENGRRPPTETVAKACDAVFPERRGWFLEYFEDSRAWMPPGFRSWPEYEDKAPRLNVWSPGIVHGLLQTEDYARSLLSTLPGATTEAIAARLANRMERQRRVLYRDDPPSVCNVIDHAALYRCVGSAEVMAAQMSQLLAVGALPNVTLQVLPAVAHPATQSGFMVADDVVYTEHVAGGYVYTDEDTVTSLARMFDKLRGECYRVSESVAIIRKAGELWTGASQATAERTAETA